MGLSGLTARLFGADDRTQAKLPVHIFMDGCGAVSISSALQIDPHAAVTIYPVMTVVDLSDLFQHLPFMGMISCLPVFTVVIVSIGTESHPAQQPADAEFCMELINKPISL